jgi:hypothetical protein
MKAAPPRPAHLVTITALAKLLGRDRTTIARWAGQGRFGELVTFGHSSTSLVDLHEARQRGYALTLPEPAIFTATDLHLALAARDAQWRAALSQTTTGAVEA